MTEEMITEEEPLQNEIIEEGNQDDIDLDEIADISIETLQGILSFFDIGEVTIDEYEGDEGELILDITGNDLSILIGRYGRTLEAMQILLSSINLRKLGFRYPVVVDVEGYKSRQREKIENIARSMARKAVSQNRDISMRPMSPYERRLVHMVLKENPDVFTESEGEGNERHIVIKLK